MYSPTVVSGKLEPFGGAIDDESTYRVKQDQARSSKRLATRTGAGVPEA
eukprot:SAG31_NODE_96_length_25743_cov_56.175948_21_plen_49_part_00